MRFMVIVKATKNSEAGVLPSQQLLADMGTFNEELTKAGVMLAGEGLQPSAKGARVTFSGGKRSAIDWVKRCPDPMPGEEAVIEIRQAYEAEDFGPALTPEVRAQEERLRAQSKST